MCSVYVLTRMLNVHAGNVLKSAFTNASTPKFASAPRIIPQGKCSIFSAACLDSMSSDEYFSSHLNFVSDRTNTPL